MKSAYESLAPLYDRLMADVDYDGWAAYLLRLMHRYLPAVSSPAVLECACGTGEITRRLLDSGCTVTASDVSAEMLAIAQQKLRLAGHASAPVVLQDMRRLLAHRPVDAVIAACDGVNYLTGDGDARSFFRSAQEALKPGGLLLFDISSAYKLTNILDGRVYGDAFSDVAYLWRNVYDARTRLLGMDLAFFIKRADGAYKRSDESQVQRAYETEELTQSLAACGFAVLGTFDAFTENDAAADSERIQFAARRE